MKAKGLDEPGVTKANKEITQPLLNQTESISGITLM